MAIDEIKNCIQHYMHELRGLSPGSPDWHQVADYILELKTMLEVLDVPVDLENFKV